MSRRSRAREVALQVLFQDDLNPQETAPPATEFLQARLKSDELVEFARSLVAGVRRSDIRFRSPVRQDPARRAARGLAGATLGSRRKGRLGSQ